MAAIDKIYLSTWEQYIAFKEWCEQQPLITDKYGKSIPITAYLYNWNRNSIKDREAEDASFPVFNAPCYVDAYLIKNCPFDFVQKELMLNYGHWDQERINEAYDAVYNRTEDNENWYTWLTPEDFQIVDGVITMPNLEKSSYQMIKDGELYNSPAEEYIIGKHFRCTKHPVRMFDFPAIGRGYDVEVRLPDKMSFMWYHYELKTWDFPGDFVIDKEGRGSHAYCKTIRALKRKMLKWRLPIGAKVIATARLVSDDYEFIITK